VNYKQETIGIVDEDQHRKDASVGPRMLKEPGEIDWCRQTLNHLSTVFHRIKDWSKRDKEEFWNTVDEIKRYEVWGKIPPDNPYGSFGKMIEAELGVSEEVAKEEMSFKEHIAELLGWGGDRKSPRFDNSKSGNQVDNCQLENRLKVSTTKGGNEIPYIEKRIKRDSPLIWADYQAGKYRSARQAGIAAGFVKDVKRFNVLPIPKKIAAKAKEMLEPDQIAELIALLESQS